ncbi:MAG: hypothetical protein PHY56_00240 [Candidatus Omnitrophica bacterium]|nr:hypothetical protein [Candidatus Omnitrophota bacterium]
MKKLIVLAVMMFMASGAWGGQYESWSINKGKTFVYSIKGFSDIIIEGKITDIAWDEFDNRILLRIIEVGGGLVWRPANDLLIIKMIEVQPEEETWHDNGSIVKRKGCIKLIAIEDTSILNVEKALLDILANQEKIIEMLNNTVIFQRGQYGSPYDVNNDDTITKSYPIYIKKKNN